MNPAGGGRRALEISAVAGSASTLPPSSTGGSGGLRGNPVRLRRRAHHVAHESFRHYELEEDLPEGLIGELLRSRYASEGLLADVELGRRDPDVLDGYFRQALAEMGWHVGPRPIHLALFSKVVTEPAMWECVAGLRTNGIATALLSNSWGTSLYDFDLVDQHFDVNVISGHVGQRKPDREIFVKTAELLSVTPEACIFVDDMDVNVQAAKAAGMTALLHTSAPATAARIDDLLAGDRPPRHGER